MNVLRIVLAIALVLTTAGVATALTLTSPPFPGQDVLSGFGQCAVVNGSTRETNTATVTMYDVFGTILGTSGPFDLLPGDSGKGTAFNLLNKAPTSCRCVVPNSKHKCSFMFFDGSNVTVIPAN